MDENYSIVIATGTRRLSKSFPTQTNLVVAIFLYHTVNKHSMWSRYMYVNRSCPINLLLIKLRSFKICSWQQLGRCLIVSSIEFHAEYCPSPQFRRDHIEWPWHLISKICIPRHSNHSMVVSFEHLFVIVIFIRFISDIEMVSFRSISDNRRRCSTLMLPTNAVAASFLYAPFAFWQITRWKAVVGSFSRPRFLAATNSHGDWFVVEICRCQQRHHPLRSAIYLICGTPASERPLEFWPIRRLHSKRSSQFAFNSPQICNISCKS